MISRAARLIGVLVLIALMGLAVTPSVAQGPPQPPAIIRFESDLTSVTASDVEAGIVTTQLSWQTVGVTNAYRVQLYAFELDAWVLLPESNSTVLPASGSLVVAVRHPRTFAQPAFRVAVLDVQGSIVAERTVTLSYASDSTTAPSIDVFTTEATVLDASAVAAGTARAVVAWSVENRGPDMNLVFEQLMPDGRVVNVELPRATLWVPSAGVGEVRPIMTPDGEQIMLRLRVVDLVNDETLAEETLDPIPLAGPLPVTVSPQYAQGGPLEIRTFSVTPDTVARGGTVTVNWGVAGANQVSVWQLTPSGELGQAAPSPTPIGSWTVTLDPAYTGSAGFVLFATDFTGAQAQRSITVRVECGMLYFFGEDSAGGCPVSDASGVLASYQEFQGGMMLLRADIGDIYVLYDTGQLGRYRDTWRGEAISLGENPPAGMIPPARSFGKVWSENQTVRINLGWATSPERAYTMRYQRAADGRLYVSLPDGSVLFMTGSAWDYERRIDE